MGWFHVAHFYRLHREIEDRCFLYTSQHYSHYLTRLATEDLTRMNSEIGLGGKIFPEGSDFIIPHVTE